MSTFPSIKTSDLKPKQRRVLSYLLHASVRMHGKTWAAGSKLVDLVIKDLGHCVSVRGYVRHKGCENMALDYLTAKHFHFFMGPRGRLSLPDSKQSITPHDLAIEISYGSR